MILFFSFIAAVFVTMALIPMLMRWAVVLHIVDIPDARKVHTGVIPRIGGLAMVVGALLPIILWLPPDREVIGYIAGVVVILFFGVWDDRCNLDYRLKFIGQIMAVLIVVTYGGMVIHYVPGYMEALPGYLAIPLTVFALLGITNAINLADGLDGLAGGTTMLSLGLIAVMAYMADGMGLVMMSVAVMGCILGFLRYNTYPARIFMGDGGSQFLGFSVGVMVIMLTQQVNSALSPAVAIMILGLPILDTFMVMSQRIYEGRSPFSPDKNHIHHKLLAIGFDHYEAVLLIYLVQSMLFLGAYFLRFQSDLLIILLYGVVCACVLGFFRIASETGWRAHNSRHDDYSLVGKCVAWLRQGERLLKAVFYFAMFSIPLYLTLMSFFISRVPEDIGAVACVLLLVLGLSYLRRNRQPLSIVERAVAYVTAAFVVYLAQVAPGYLADYTFYRNVFFVLLAIAVAIGFRFSQRDRFQITPMDFLIVFIALIVPNLPGSGLQTDHLAEGVAKVIVLFYGIELILQNTWRRWNTLRLATAIPLVILGIRGVL